MAQGSSKCNARVQEEPEASPFLGSQEEQGQGEGCKVGGRPSSVNPLALVHGWVVGLTVGGWLSQNPPVRSPIWLAGSTGHSCPCPCSNWAETWLNRPGTGPGAFISVSYRPKGVQIFCCAVLECPWSLEACVVNTFLNGGERNSFIPVRCPHRLS